MKKTRFNLAVILGLLLSLVSTMPFSHVGLSDPYLWGGSAPPPEGTVPPKISVLFPNNNTVFNSSEFPLAFTVNITDGVGQLTDVWYEVDWRTGNASVCHLDMSTAGYVYNNSRRPLFVFNTTLPHIPDGTHVVKVFANGEGSYITYVDEPTYYVFDIAGSSSVNFTVDTIPLIVSFSSAQNKTYDATNVTLSFVVNKPVSKIIYSLDNHANVTSSGDSWLTIPDLSNGEHNVTIYAQDEAGIISAPNTLYFDVKVEAFPAATVAAVSGASATVVVVAGLVIYFKKCKREAPRIRDLPYIAIKAPSKSLILPHIFCGIKTSQKELTPKLPLTI